MTSTQISANNLTFKPLIAIPIWKSQTSIIKENTTLYLKVVFPHR